MPGTEGVKVSLQQIVMSLETVKNCLISFSLFPSRSCSLSKDLWAKRAKVKQNKPGKKSSASSVLSLSQSLCVCFWLLSFIWFWFCSSLLGFRGKKREEEGAKEIPESEKISYPFLCYPWFIFHFPFDSSHFFFLGPSSVNRKEHTPLCLPPFMLFNVNQMQK